MRADMRAIGPERSSCPCVAGDDAVAEFSVLSDGAPIPADVEPYLFEPFFSTRSRGAGPGPFTFAASSARDTVRASTTGFSPPDAPRRNDFFVDMRRAELLPTEARLHLTP